MCTEDVHTVVFPDGREEESRSITRCDKAPRGYQCAQPRVFSYPKTYYAPAVDARFPPTPRMTPAASPRPTTPLAYYSASGGESDHSRRSGNSNNSGSPSSAAAARRGDRYTTYHTTSTTDPSGAKVININHRSSGRKERILIVDNPPTPRTPPQAFAMPYTAPSSPRTGFTMAAEHYARPGRRDTLLRPVIVDERPSTRHVRFDAAGPSTPSSGGHRRAGSNESRNSYSASDDDRRYPPSSSRRPLPVRRETTDFVLFPEQDDAARRRERRRRDQQAAAAAAAPSGDDRLDRDLRKAERIAQLNSSIDARAAVPIPGMSRTATDVAAEQRDRDLRESIRNMNIGPAPSIRRRGTGMTLEEEAQKRRLEERMMPRRRASVGPGARRGRAVYENGVYVWE
ncbi:hypothetical protein B0T11DRAFT_292365 [Plectosphaerella cucumerina]|uniref:Uncharacterized protein n=1 Tax=Plectosphaerella cucumerina TaxID=40658 RepID=A0A8K0TTV8_9PEZI|nr:hypothetical protein B0T11DRAFT_292365 [Plectosphaerella cucumerina]